MKRTGLIRLGGLAVMVGSVVFALGLLLRYTPLLNDVLAEAITVLVLFLPVVVVSVAIVAIAALLRGTRHSSLGVLASIGPLVGLALIFLGLLLIQDRGFFVGLGPLSLGIFLLTVSLGGLAILMMVSNVLPWWSGVALLVGGPLPFLIVALADLLTDLLVWELLEGAYWLIGVPWILVGYAIFRAGSRQTQQPARVSR